MNKTYSNLLCITRTLSKQKSENLEKKRLRVKRNVRVIHKETKIYSNLFKITNG
jgi:hypothetical protein